MRVYVRTFCRNSVASKTTDAMQVGIAERLDDLLSQLCQNDEPAAEDILGRLRIENESESNSFEVFHLRYHDDSDHLITIERCEGYSALVQIQEYMAHIRYHTDPGGVIIRDHLSSAVETVSFEMELTDAEGTGLAVAMAAAAWLAEIGNGIIHAQDLGWMLPEGKEVRFLSEL